MLKVASTDTISAPQATPTGLRSPGGADFDIPYFPLIAGQIYASAGGVDQALPVDVFIPGCASRPEAIIFGIPLAIGRMAERRG